MAAIYATCFSVRLHPVMYPGATATNLTAGDRSRRVFHVSGMMTCTAPDKRRFVRVLDGQIAAGNLPWCDIAAPCRACSHASADRHVHAWPLGVRYAKYEATSSGYRD